MSDEKKRFLKPVYEDIVSNSPLDLILVLVNFYFYISEDFSTAYLEIFDWQVVYC